jgi:hypothetical protein
MMCRNFEKENLATEFAVEVKSVKVKVKVARGQGDQIGRIFAHWAIV